MNKKKLAITVLSAIILLTAVIAWSINQSNYNGSTEESREQIINKDKKGAVITTEIKIEDYIISGLSLSDGKYGIAVFAPSGSERYKLQTRTFKEKDEILTFTQFINGKDYLIIWQNQGMMEYAEVIFTVDNKEYSPLRLDATQNQLLYCESPGLENDFSANVSYYDLKGNKF